jgi:fructose-specific phosphotransferase system IIC component
MSGNMIPIVIMTGLFVLIGFIVKTVADGRRRREHLKTVTEFHNRLLDKLGSISDFAQFLQTDGGSRFLDTLSSERSSTGPRERIMRAVHVGTIMTVVGLGLLVISFSLSHDKAPLGVLGGIVLSIGVGYLASSAASYRLAKTLGVLEEADAGRASRG